MAGGNFMSRVMFYVANELLINSITNSRAFQKFAVRTSRRIDDLSKIVTEKQQQMKKFWRNVQQESLKNK